ncbi:MAG: alcohol dehydrogenase catalytic domain-containing protein [Anaerolineales bacterium]|nr:alcohol dehydrogenase catalytic domain-containing protein [Anaerolineales bacterium]
MKAMLLRESALFSQNPTHLSFEDLPEPKIDAGEILLRVTRCGICHTELDEIEDRIKPRLPIILGHQVVGNILKSDSKLSDFRMANASGWHGSHPPAEYASPAYLAMKI